jgi:hypothetical protein
MRSAEITLRCVHDGGIILVNAANINEIRDIYDDDHGQWTRIKMSGSDPIEVRETFEEVSRLRNAAMEDL